MLTATKGNHNDQAYHLDARRHHRTQLRVHQLRCAEADPEAEGPGADLLHARDRPRVILNQTINRSTNHRHSRRTTMTKLIISMLAAAIALSSVSTSFAAPKQTPKQTVQEPLYFTLATGQ